MKSKFSFLFTAIFLFFLGVPLSASLEIGEPNIRNFEPREYGGNSQIWGVVQDQRGVIFFATTKNVFEFDGKYWQEHVIPCDIVRSIASDENGTVYIGGSGDFGYLASDLDGQLVYRSLLDQVPSKDKDFKDVWATHSTSHGVYFCTKKKIFRWFQNQVSVLSVSSANWSYKVFDDVYINNRKEFVHLRDGKLTPLPYTDFVKNNHRILALQFKQDDQILFISQKTGCFLYDLNKAGQTPEKIVTKFPTEIDEYLLNNGLYSGIQLNNHTYALCTLKGGIVIMDSQGKLVRIINENRGLLKNMTLSAFQDRNEDLWVGLYGGIAHIEINSPLSFFGKLSGIESGVDAAIRHQGQIYVGTFNEGPMVMPPYRLKNSNDSHVFEAIKDFQGKYGWQFLEIDNQLLVAAEYVQVIENKVATSLKKPPTLYSLHRSPRFPQTIFLGISGSGDGGVGKLKILEDGGFEYMGRLPGISEIILDIVSDHQGNLWLATQNNGLIHVEFRNGSTTEFDIHSYTPEHGLPSMNGNSILWDKDRLLVTSSDAKGIFKAIKTSHAEINKHTYRFEPQYLKGGDFEGTPENISYIATYGDDQYLVESSGLAILSRAKDGIWKINSKPLKGTELFQSNAYVESNGVAWIGSENGLYRYDPKQIKNFEVPYSVLIRQVKTKSGKDLFNGTFYDVESQRGEYYTTFSTKQPEYLIPSLEYEENSLTFHYSALFFEKMTENQFQFYLIGFDDNWSDWTTKTEKEYTNIPEGNYCFKVRAKNVYDYQSNIAEFCFSITPPWHRTIWAYLIYILLFILFTYATIRLNTRRLLAAKKRLEQIVTERTAEIVRQKDEIEDQKIEIESAYGDLTLANKNLTEARNALWGEMELAKKIQTILLPKEPKIPGYEITGYMKPADEVGGDYYDVINAEGRDWIVIGDVSGHGVHAGLIMMMVQTAIHQALDNIAHLSPAKILESINRVIYKNIQKLGEAKYMTITVFSYIEDGKFHFSGLHQDIIIYRSEKKEVELIETNGMWIGIMDEIGAMLDMQQLSLNPRDVMLLFTDGIVEATNENKEMYSDKKLEQVFKELGHLPPKEIQDGILESLSGYTCNDDVTMIIFKRV